jgi:hypothetical protein
VSYHVIDRRAYDRWGIDAFGDMTYSTTRLLTSLPISLD